MREQRTDPMTVDEFRERAESLAAAIEDLHAAHERACKQAHGLYNEIGGTRTTELVRFDYEIAGFLRMMANDLAAANGDDERCEGGDFDIKRSRQDARDLLDLIALAAMRSPGDDRPVPDDVLPQDLRLVTVD